MVLNQPATRTSIDKLTNESVPSNYVFPLYLLNKYRLMRTCHNVQDAEFTLLRETTRIVF